MRTSDRGIAALVGHEGIVPGPYWDTATPPVLTWGIGHTAAAGAPFPEKMPRGMPVDLDTALREVFTVFAADLASYEAAVNAAVTVPLTQHEYDALVSFHYNTGAISRATLTQLLNKGDRAGAAKAFLNWKTPSSIIDRRKAELALFRDGIYPASPLTVWNVSASRKVILAAARTITVSDALALMRENWSEDQPSVAETEDAGAEETDNDTGLPILARGSKGAHVKLAQARLAGRGYSLSVDGLFGARTEAIVKRYQRENMLVPDGRVGPLTWNSLNLNQGF